MIDDISRLPEQSHALWRQRQIRRPQALEQALQRRKQLGQQRDIDHGDGAMQGMHSSQQFFADRQFVAAALDGCADRLQVLCNFATQYLQQYRVDRRHYRQCDGLCRFDHRMIGSRRLRIGQGCLWHCLDRNVETAWHTTTHDTTDCFSDRRGVVFDPCRMSSRQLFGYMHDRAERCARRAFALERNKQPGQCFDRVVYQRLNLLVRLNAVVQHAIEHVLHFPREFAQHAGADQSARTLQRVERTTDTDQ